MPPFYGQQTNQPQQPGPQAYQPWQPQKSGYKNMSENAYATGVNAQAGKDSAAFGALSNLGVAGQNAMGQYGMAQQNALMNSQIAQANALGQLGTGYYNTLGQLGQANTGMVAAASQAGGDTNKAAALGGLANNMLTAGAYGASMAPYTAGNMPNFNFGGFGGGGGFRSSGPEGTIASGNMGGPRVGGWPDGGRRGFNPPPAPPTFSGGGAKTYDPYQPFNQGSKNLQSMLGMMQNPQSMPNLVRNDMNNAFQSTQKNMMDPGIRDSLNSQMAMGTGAISGLYNQSDYGFNTGQQFRPQYYSNRWSGPQFNF